MTIVKISGTPEQLQARRVWVNALRSGKYKQTTGMLRSRDGGFCCLGVACEISGLGNWQETATAHKIVDFVYLVDGQSLVASLGVNNPVQEMFGVGSKGFFLETIYEAGNSANNLYNLNDSLNWPFEAIADFIEQHWEVAPE